MEKINKITLYQDKVNNGGREQWACITKAGELRLEGFDYGEAPLLFFGDSDYEYWRLVDKDWKDTLLLLLIKEIFKDFDSATTWLEKKEIPMKCGSYY